MITEDYVSFEIAKLLKEKRFDEKCRAYYKVFPESRIAAIYYSSENRGVSEDDPNEILCPTLQMTMKWLREEYNLHVDSSIYIDTDGDSEHEYTYTYWDWLIFNSESGRRIAEPQIGCGRYDSYEQACEAAIKYCLKNLI